MVLIEDKGLEEYAEEEDEEEEDKEKESFEGGTTNSTTTVPPNSFFYQTITSSSSSTHSRWVGGGAGEPSLTETGTAVVLEKEHMFDKVVTPSDVGKLNRLVIPKQHAERYFPLDSAGSEKGLLLNFEDGAGKQWRFRYSYWNSSQSYVMTKGWSRFVKEKKLDAGDIVSFERGSCVPHRHRFFIDWKRRPGLHPSHLPHHHQHHRSVPWGHLFFPPMHTYTSYATGSAASFHNLHPLLPPPPLVYESVPLMQGKTGPVMAAAARKRVRLFGVNLDCPEQHELQQHQQQQYGYGCNTEATAKLSPHLQLQLYNNGSAQAPTSSAAARKVPGKQKQSLSLDLDI